VNEVVVISGPWAFSEAQKEPVSPVIVLPNVPGLAVARLNPLVVVRTTKALGV
jgi:hypothetical protein